MTAPAIPVDAAAALGRRPEGPADEPFRYALFCASRPPGDGLFFLDAPLRETLLRQQFAGQAATYRMQYPDADCAIVLSGDAPIGRMVIARTAEALVLVDIALLPVWRGRGIGTRLITELCAEAHGRPVRLSVGLGNPEALRLYQRLGFVIAARSATGLRLEWTASAPHAPS